MVFPWISFLQERKKRLSDIEYLAIKEFDGKLRTTEGTLSVTGDLATLTANSGKDMYLAKAKVNCRLENTNAGSEIAVIELKAGVSGSEVVKATWACQLNAGTGGEGTSETSYEFVVSGIKVAASQIIKLEVITLDTLIEANGELVVFEETTGESPAV